jgi:DNA mismatch repair protein MutS
MQTTTSNEYFKLNDPAIAGTEVVAGPLTPAPATQTTLASFKSILFEPAGARTRGDKIEPPAFFRDLNLDQIVDAITAGREEYNLKPFFYTRVTNPDGIAYRHEVMRDLERDALFHSIKSFSTQMHGMRVRLAASEKSYYKYQKEALFLEAAEIYCDAVEKLLGDLREHASVSRGLLAFRTWLAEYAASDAFKTLTSEVKELKSELSAIRYAVLIKGSSITVRNYDSEPDYSAAVEATFAKFKQGAVQDYLVKFSDFSGMNHVEAMVLDRVALLNPKVFLALDDFCVGHKGFPDQTITDFDREIQFYVAWLEFAEKFERAGLRFCYPQVSDTCKNVISRDGFDLALAGKLVRENTSVVCNDFALSGSERIFVVSGPNQGGKTTFARTFGQLHYLASLGCPVPGTDAQLFLCDQLFTHFEREEDITTLRGKLEDDLVRIHHILQQATPNSVIIINEIFSSTTLKDAVHLGSKVIERIAQLDALCVCVTFLDELSSLNEKTVSMVAEVVPKNPALRTFKLNKRPADGLAYALAIAEKYRLTYERLKERLKP